MRFALSLPNFGELADIRAIADVARAAEAGGWDGVFLWDHIAPSFAPGTSLPTADVTVALTAIALATERVRFGPMVCPLPRRRPQKVARELVSLDRLSEGRVVLGVGLGHPPDTEFEAFGEPTDARRRGDLLDEALDVVTGLWSGDAVDHRGTHLHVRTPGFVPGPVQRPRIPVWVAATWPGHPRPVERSRRWDGLVPISADLETPGFLTPDDIRELVARVDRPPPFDVVVTAPPDGDPHGFEAAGATWWMEVVFGVDDALARAAAGPPT